MDVQLIPLDGGPSIRLERDLTIIGRKRWVCDVTLASERASKVHCMIYRDQDRFYVQDLGSANGTKVNGTAIADETALRHGDMLECGRERFAVEIRHAMDQADTDSAVGTHRESPLMAQVLNELHPRSAGEDDHPEHIESVDYCRSSVFAADSCDSVPDWMEG